MALDRLRLKNFQGHEKLSVDLSRITTFIGRSDSGKSSIMRALSLLALNKPSGTGFITHGKSSCELSLEFDGRVLRRVRGQSSNEYELDGKKFHAFGQEVPEEIRDALKIGELNFQRQFDPPFWLSDPAPEVARKLNQIVDLGLIDESLSRGAACVRKAKIALELAQEREVRAGQELVRTEFVEEFGLSAKAAIEHHEELQKLILSKRSLDEALLRVRELAKSASSKIPDLGGSETTYDEIRDLTARRESLCRVVSQIRRLEREFQRAQEEAERAEDDLKGLAEVCPTCGRPIR